MCFRRGARIPSLFTWGSRWFATEALRSLCGKKATAGSIAGAAVDAFTRGLEMTPPSQFCDPTELIALGDLYAAHFGNDAEITRAARLGIFSHHGNTPQGIRLSVEVAIKENLAKFVICTSTLAQGVTFLSGI